MAVISRRSSRRRFTLILLILTSITLITLDYRGFEPLERLRTGVLSLFAPVADTAGDLTSPLSDAWDGAFQQGDLAEENARLREELEVAQGEALSNRIAQESLAELLAQANLPFVGDVPTVRAQVAAGPVSNFDATVEIDRGTNSGIQPGMAVVTGRGLVGKVLSAAGDRAVVELLHGGTYRVGVSVVGSNVVGTVEGRGGGQLLRGVVDAGSEVSEDQILITDGIGQRSTFPRGLPVGTVVAVRHTPGALERELDVEMLAATSDLTYVSVVLWQPST